LGVLYPLWPSQLRGGVYYISWGGLGFVGFVIVLAILRTILFALIWLFSGGKHHLWIFPNLTEDCGPIESFFPLYTYKYTGMVQEFFIIEEENSNFANLYVYTVMCVYKDNMAKTTVFRDNIYEPLFSEVFIIFLPK
jgi:hypothetical protein